MLKTRYPAINEPEVTVRYNRNFVDQFPVNQALNKSAVLIGFYSGKERHDKYKMLVEPPFELTVRGLILILQVLT